MKNLITIIILLCSISLSFGQDINPVIHPFGDSWVLSAEGGLNIGDTDFPDTKIDYHGRGVIEYFFPTNSASAFGVRLLGGAGYVAGKGQVNFGNVYLNIDEISTEYYHVGLGLTYSYSLGTVVQPYLSSGVSYFNFNPLAANGLELPQNSNDVYSKNDLNFMGELGLRFLVSENISFNTGYTFNFILDDYVDDVTINDNDDRFHSIFGGVSYYFMSESDSDEDGVKDSKDMCLNTPKGVSVDEFGCPSDSDNDKIADYQDICPDTPANVKVDSDGCPVDIDKDGIADYLDKCPNTKLNAKVDNFGCEKIEIIEQAKTKKLDAIVSSQFTELDVIESTVNFKTGKTELLPNQKLVLDKLAESMKENIDTKWAVLGYADNLGSEDDNIKLSFDRANIVAEYLIKSGVSKQKLQIYGLGPNHPVADNSVEFGRALNRRTEIIELSEFAERNSKLKTIDVSNYDLSKEYNIGSLIFTDGNYYCIQVSSWANPGKAKSEVEKLISKGHSAYSVTAKLSENNKIMHRVRIGYFESLESAKEYQKIIR